MNGIKTLQQWTQNTENSQLKSHTAFTLYSPTARRGIGVGTATSEPQISLASPASDDNDD